MATRTSIREAFDRLIIGCPAEHSSQELLCSRAIVLKAAADNLLDPMLRKAHDQTDMLEIPQADLPGAIALLVESGDWSSAVEWGQAWLESHRRHSCSADVALCIAVAHYKLTVSKIDQSFEHALECEAGLTQSLDLLQRYKTAPDLQAELKETLQVLAPQIALQLVSQSNNQQLRQKGLNMVKSLLWREGQPVQGFPVLKLGRGQYMKALRRHLSSAEQVQMMNGPSAFQAISDEEHYDNALALLSSGFHSHNPGEVESAANILAVLDNKLEPATGRKRFDALDVSVETSICQILLGKIDAAEISLGLSKSAVRNPDPGIKQFVMRESGPDSIDLVPGLYSLAQQWLADVAAQRFQELRHPDASLDQWFKSRRVMQHLQVADSSHNQQEVLLVLAAIRDGIASIVERLLAAIAGLLHALLPSPQRVTSDPQVGPSPVQEPEPTDFPKDSVSQPAVTKICKDCGCLKISRPGDDEFSNTDDIATEASQGNEAHEIANEALHPLVPDSRTPAMSSQQEPQTRRLRAGSSSSRDTDQDSSGPRAIISVSLLHEPDPRSKQYRKTALRQDEGVPLEAVSDQTVGEIQQQIKDAIPLEVDVDEGFGTDYDDLPSVEYPKYRARSQVRSRFTEPQMPPKLLLLDGEAEMWAPGRKEKQRAQTLFSAAALVCLVSFWDRPATS